MSTKNHRSGGKFRGSHTTIIPTAGLMADIAECLPEVTKISPGFIKAGLPPVNGKRRMKIIRKDSYILLSVRDNTTHQELAVYTSNADATTLSLARGARNAGLHISFS